MVKKNLTPEETQELIWYIHNSAPKRLQFYGNAVYIMLDEMQGHALLELSDDAKEMPYTGTVVALGAGLLSETSEYSLAGLNIGDTIVCNKWNARTLQVPWGDKGPVELHRVHVSDIYLGVVQVEDSK